MSDSLTAFVFFDGASTDEQVPVAIIRARQPQSHHEFLNNIFEALQDGDGCWVNNWVALKGRLGGPIDVEPLDSDTVRIRGRSLREGDIITVGTERGERVSYRCIDTGWRRLHRTMLPTSIPRAVEPVDILNLFVPPTRQLELLYESVPAR